MDFVFCIWSGHGAHATTFFCKFSGFLVFPSPLSSIRVRGPDEEGKAAATTLLSEFFFHPDTTFGLQTPSSRGLSALTPGHPRPLPFTAFGRRDAQQPRRAEGGHGRRGGRSVCPCPPFSVHCLTWTCLKLTLFKAQWCFSSSHQDSAEGMRSTHCTFPVEMLKFKVSVL